MCSVEAFFTGGEQAVWEWFYNEHIYAVFDTSEGAISQRTKGLQNILYIDLNEQKEHYNNKCNKIHNIYNEQF